MLKALKGRYTGALLDEGHSHRWRGPAWPCLGEAATGGCARPGPPKQGHVFTLPRPSVDLEATERGWQVNFPSQAVKASPANGRQD